MTSWFSEAAARLSADPLLQGLLAALATFILEDPTTVGCGLLVADGRMAFSTALIGVSAGIALGDVGLYSLGRLAGPRSVRWGIVSQDRLDRVSGWFRRNLVLAVVLSRFVPGMRLPTYVGAGIARAPAGLFVLLAVGASVVWTTLLLWITVAAGETALPLLGRWRWPAALAALLLLVLVQRRAARGIEARAGAQPHASMFEFWPPWLFYLPVAFYYLWLAARFRGLMLPTVANPSIYSGGLIGESKSQILDLVPGPWRKWIAPYVVFERPARQTPPERVLDEARRAIDESGLSYPLVAKPDMGQRGAGVRPIFHDADLGDYLQHFPQRRRVLLQRFVASRASTHDTATDRDPRLDGVREAGVLYWRAPGAESGEIFSITLKLTPELTGDGRSSLRELIEADTRARRLRRVYFRRHARDLDRVPAAGERLPLVFAGNHCQGAVFLDGTDLATPELLDRIHGIAAAMPEFYFGRFDVCFGDPAAFLRGEELHVIEINGAGAEATHIWDASARLVDAYRTLFRQFRILFEIGAANRRRGFRPLGVARFLEDVRAYRRLARSYPMAS